MKHIPCKITTGMRELDIILYITAAFRILRADGRLSLIISFAKALLVRFTFFGISIAFIGRVA